MLRPQEPLREGRAHHHGPIEKPRFHHRHFFVAPFYSFYYPGWPIWPGWDYPYGYDDYYLEPYSYGDTAPQSQLPSNDMLAVALPEGVIEPGGRVEGFLYFQRVPAGSVQFEMVLVDAETGTQFGSVTTPLVVP